MTEISETCRLQDRDVFMAKLNRINQDLEICNEVLHNMSDDQRCYEDHLILQIQKLENERFEILEALNGNSVKNYRTHPEEVA